MKAIIQQTPGCIIHCRVSSTKQSQEGESLPVQGGICEKLAANNGWTLLHTPWLESFSGRKTTRPVFIEILDFIDNHPGKVQYYIFRSIDRFTRGGSYTYEQMKRELTRRGVAMIDGNGVIQPMRNTLEDVDFEYGWSKQSPSEISELVLATTAKQEVTSILTRMIGQEIRLVNQGYKVRCSQDGYINKKIYVEGKKRTIQVPDPERAKFFIMMFELRAAGHYSDQEIVDRVNAIGYRTKFQNRWDRSKGKILGQSGGHPLTVKKLQYHIQKPIYPGVIVEKWTKGKPVKAQYAGLVSFDLFNRANRGKVFIREAEGLLEILYNYLPNKVTNKRERHNPQFPYKFILCPACNKPFLGSQTRGKSGKKFSAYHCARNHARVGINKKDFEETVESFFEKLEFQPEILTSLHAVILDRYRERQGSILETASQVGYNVAELEVQKAQAVRSYISASVGFLKAEIEKEISSLDEQIKNAQSERNKLEVTDRDVEDFIAEAKSIMEHPAKMLMNSGNSKQTEALLGLFFETMPTYDEIRSGTPKLCWIFKLSSGSIIDKSQLVTPPGIEPGLTA